MICSTSFFSKLALGIVLIPMVTLWGCARYKTAITVFLPQSTEVAIKSETPIRDRDLLISVLPLENLSGTKAPLNEITALLRYNLARKGYRLLDSEQLEQFRKKYRMRYTGGINAMLAEALREELDIDAILISSLEAYNESYPPQISLISRLVTSGSNPEIIWMDSVGLSGDQSPGLLDLNLIRDSQPLMEKAADELIRSLADHLDQKNQKHDVRLNRKYLPYDYFRSQAIDPERAYSIAVIPMRNLAVRKNAAEIISLHYVKELLNQTNFKVFEPGLVRDELLRFRAIMPAGPSLAEADLIASDASLGVDLVLSGKVFDYQNESTNPKVDFSVQMIEKTSRKIVFGARTFSEGLKGVYFFNFGRIFTAHDLAEEMSRVTVQLLTTPTRRWEGRQEFIALILSGQEGETIGADEMFAATGAIDWDKLFEK
jgi:hypothetical protein